MSQIATWSLVIGVLLISMTLVGSAVERLPITPAIIYLAVGYALGGTRLHALDPIANAALVEALAEVAVAIALFAVGLRLRAPLVQHAWRVPLRLALPGMVLTIALVAVAAQALYGMPIGMALVLAAILAPTDPVLASDVQIDKPGDRDHVRFGLTAEGGVNDGLAAPAVLLGLGVLGLHDLGDFGLRWLLVDVLWLTMAGLAIGWLAGALIGRLVIYLRSTHCLAVGFEEFLSIGLMGFAFGAATLAHGSGFLAVFAAGLALRHFERRTSTAAGVRHEEVSVEDASAAIDPARGPAHMTQALLAFNEQAERIAELAMVMLVGGLLARVSLDWQALGIAAILLLVARPVAVTIALAGSDVSPAQRRLITWFGIRGIGTLYYLAYTLRTGIDMSFAERFLSIVLTVIAVSIVVHGISATPLMEKYRRWHGKGKAQP